MMRSIKSQLAVETANRTNFEDATWSGKIQDYTLED